MIFWNVINSFNAWNVIETFLGLSQGNLILLKLWITMADITWLYWNWECISKKKQINAWPNAVTWNETEKWFVKNKMICDYKENALCFMIY